MLLSRPRGLWPSPEHGKVTDRASTPQSASTPGAIDGELPKEVHAHLTAARQIPPAATHIAPSE